jgi:SAM-dependent methyltransferase
VSVERITNPFVGPDTYGHEFRYHLAKGFLRRGGTDVVLDAACGIGYGYDIMQPGPAFYLGVDREQPTACHGRTRVVDLQTWEPSLSFAFDMAVGFETIEHLADFSHYVEVLKQARRWILVSAPVIPTVGTNPYHLHDFAPGDLARIFEDEDWETYQVVQQPTELAEIAVFRRR